MTKPKTKGTDIIKKLIALVLALLVVFSLSATAFAAPPENLISKERAKEFALDHAGYEYEINAETGKIIAFDKDFND